MSILNAEYLTSNGFMLMMKDKFAACKDNVSKDLNSRYGAYGHYDIVPKVYPLDLSILTSSVES